MKTTSTLKKLLMKALCLMAFATLFTVNVNAQSFVEEFDDVTTLWANGWDSINHSTTHGTTTWYQGLGTMPVSVFPAYSGVDSNSYIAADFNNVTGTGTINSWLIAPTRMLDNGDEIIFYTRKNDSNAVAANNYPDRMQVRYSTNGSSADVGTTATAVGDYTNMLVNINPSLSIQGFEGGGYPYTWTKYDLTLSGLSGPTSGRFAFRYFVTSGGPTGVNSDYIGVDSVAYISIGAVGIAKENRNLNISVYPNPSAGDFKIEFNSEKPQAADLYITNELGQVVFEQNINVASGTNTRVLDLKYLANGVYTMKIRGTSAIYQQKLVIQD